MSDDQGNSSAKMLFQPTESEEYIKTKSKSHPYQNIIFGDGA
jgi:hypothetical protein